MAERRMFAKTIIDSDAFLEMPQSSQLLYFHLSMRADDDGFINKPKTIMRMVGCKDDDLRILISKRFIIPFDTGIVVIKHWKIHNYIQNDRYNETKYKEEKALLSLDENKAYKLESNECIQNVSTMDTQVRLGKDSIDKDNIKNSSRFTPPTLEEVKKYCNERSNNVDAERFIDFYSSKGWMVGKNKMKDWKACVRTWERDKKDKSQTNPINQKIHNFPEREYTGSDYETMEQKLLNRGR
ncbi:MAG: Uncharacterized protein K0S47_3168 [Herbinix sp.]|jgi:hypothetical protein|nr:Uncharacterized protein [Herbinix sp.]